MADQFEVNVTDPMFGANLGQRVLINVHDPALCEGQGCCIHHPSDHHMKNWKQLWRADKRMMERICMHGVGHPDPDDLAYQRSIGNDWAGIHGCDGCCSKHDFKLRT